MSFITEEMIRERVSEFIDRSKGLGIKVTPQRVAIYRELASTDQHPSTETIYKKIKDYYPNISLTTVYRTLETFEKLGLISVVNVLYNAARYDANLAPHNHIVCIECKKVEDIYDESSVDARRIRQDPRRLPHQGLFDFVKRHLQRLPG